MVSWGAMDPHVSGIPGFCLELVPLQGLELGDDMSLGVYVCVGTGGIGAHAAGAW